MSSRTVTSVLPFTELSVAGPYDGHFGNFDESRSPIDRIVLHTMVGTADSAAARFSNPASNVSAHYGVRYDGSLIHWLEETFTAYHAGDYAMNQRSIGIEHEDMGNYNDPRPDVLYQTSGKLVADICKFYSIPCDRDHIKKHNEVSDHPTQCPDALDIDRIIREAQGVLNPAPTPVPTPPDPCANVKDQLKNALLANSQQADLIAGLRKELTDCQNQPIPPSIVTYFQPKTSLGKLFEAWARSVG